MPLAEKMDKKYSYADYLVWDDERRWEIINGALYDMTPAPLEEHQAISGIIHGEFYIFFKDKPCRVYHAPFDVRFGLSSAEDSEINTVVQPDISVICDERKLDKRGAIGAPDLIVEILSPSTSHKDQSIKFNIYEQYGVKEYWIVDPGNKYIQIFILEKGKFREDGLFEENSTAVSKIFKGLKIPLSLIFNKK